MRTSATILVVVLAAAPALAFAGDAMTGEDYLREIKPLLERRCYSCHGALQQKRGLRLDTVALIKKGSKGGAVVEPGNADESTLVAAVTGEWTKRMPPEGEPLTAPQIDRIRAWIDAGAPAPSAEEPQKDPSQHWAFVPPVRATPPHVQDEAWSRHPIDAFLAFEQEQQGIRHRPPADRATLLRRVSLDLTGLAPTREELHAFLNDDSDQAYERVVDRLLASPRHGERWGRHWMDIWRYSDWAGYGAEVRESQPNIWRWRDWIIEGLNGDKPYDRMLQEMLAGDEIAPEDPATLRATGFLVRNWYKFNRHTWLDATVEHTAKAFLGITLNCARCHDHKYDPFAQADYYRFQAFFQAHEIATDRVPGQADATKNGVVRVFDGRAAEPTYLLKRGDEKQPDESKPITPGVPAVFRADIDITPVALPKAAFYPAIQPFIQTEALAQATAQTATAAKALAQARAAEDAAREQSVKLLTRLDVSASERETAARAADRARDQAAVAADEVIAAQAGLEATRSKIAADAARFATPPDSKRADILAIQATHAERQAALLAATAAVGRAQFAVAHGNLNKAKAAAAEAKLAAAKKAVEDARKTAAGAHSAKYTPLVPPRPETSTGRRQALARWITDRKNPLTARVAVNHVWARHFGSPLVPTVFDFGRNGKPPTHPALLDWLAVEFMESGWSLKHLHRLIVTSQAYRMQSWTEPDDPNEQRDAANRTLWRMNVHRMEAELVRDNVLQVTGALDTTLGGPELDQNAGMSVFRRSMYFRQANEKVMTFLKIFDSANVNACYRRDESVVPQQALALANSPLAMGRARALAQTLSKQARDDDAFLVAAFEQILGRAPSAEERDACLSYLTTQARKLADPSKLTPFSDGPKAVVPPATDPTQRARENLVHVLINHNDFVTIR